MRFRSIIDVWILACSKSSARSENSPKSSLSLYNMEKKSLQKQKRKKQQRYQWKIAETKYCSKKKVDLSARSPIVREMKIESNKLIPLVTANRGGSKKIIEDLNPSIMWPILHNWMYLLSLGFNLINVPFLVRSIIDNKGKALNIPSTPSPRAISLSGRIESVDRFLTFLGVGFLSSLSDKYGRRPLMIWSSMGFMLTNLLQAMAPSEGIAILYLADFIDGCTSCMLPLCQAYVTDCSPPDQLATKLGMFQGITGRFFSLLLSVVSFNEISYFSHLTSIFNSAPLMTSHVTPSFPSLPLYFVITFEK